MKRLTLLVLATLLSGAAVSLHAADAASVERGNVVFQHWCSACHSGGKSRAGTMALAAKYSGNVPAELEKRTDLTPELIHFMLRNGVSIMPFFRKTEITPGDESDLIAYLTRNHP